MLKCTVNSEIFTRVLFSRNFAYAKFREKNSRYVEISLSLTDVVYSCPSCDFEMWQICLLTKFAKIKFSQNFRIYSIRKQNLIKIFHAVQDLRAFLLKDLDRPK